LTDRQALDAASRFATAPQSVPVSFCYAKTRCPASPLKGLDNFLLIEGPPPRARQPVRHAGINEQTWKLLGNAPIESFWGSLKNELVYHRKFATRQQAQKEITEYIEIFYNRQGTQERLDYLSPAAFTQRFYLNKIAA
jgi:hypothetical protein